ncbi:hypothetical protein VTJ83DRAFT_6081 [Remersonia thermophila]|uniref:Uncharacterized protein n=1 Tax=Remersonia thermophila TaxID=72144 RepID=A0ABR4DAT6_9PEZI
MCNYDYTPYKGCADGEQHYFIQWIKCGMAAESGRYCSLEASTRLEQIPQISGNVLACPLHGPVAVQQYILEAASPRHHEEDEEKRRPRSTTRRSGVSRGRGPRRDSSRAADEAAHKEVKEVRRESSRHEAAHDSSDSETNSRENRARRARKASRQAESERGESGRKPSRTRSHRRATSEDLDRIPPVPPLSMRYGRSETSLPLKTQPEDRRDSRRASNASTTHLQSPTDAPRAPTVVGLPSSPDMHHRASIRRAQSDALLKDADLPPLPSPRSWVVSPTSDSSPDHDPALPFSSPGRRGRRPTRSIGDRSVDTSMRRIDEDVATDDLHSEPPLSPRSLPPQPGPAPTRSPPPEPTAAGALHYPSRRSRSANRPQLNSLKIPKPLDKYQREHHSAPTATPPDTEISEGRKRSVDAALGNAPQAARESSSNLPTTARASVDSGYLSGHSKNGRNTLQKAPPQLVREQAQQQQQQQQQQQTQQQTQQSLERGQNQEQSPTAAAQEHARPSTDGRESPDKKPRPAPLNLANAAPGHRLPPCALPVSLISPSCQSDAEASTASNGSKKTHSTLLQRMGLKRKISGLLERERAAGGAKEVGVKG